MGDWSDVWVRREKPSQVAGSCFACQARCVLRKVRKSLDEREVLLFGALSLEGLASDDRNAARPRFCCV